jgi:cation:H+ antiporter
MELLWVWLQFAGLTVVIGFAGYRLSHDADRIADATGIGHAWVGTIMLATVTSLPELMTGVSAVTFAGSPNLAVGDVLGSCVFNLVLVFVLDLIHRGSSVYSRATHGLVLIGALGMILISFVGFSLMVTGHFPGVSIGHVGAFTAVIPLFYILASRTIYIFERGAAAAAPAAGSRPSAPQALKKSFLSFGVAAAVVIAAGGMLPFVGERIMTEMGWNAAFVGTLFLAFATSLPEIAVTLGAMKLNAPQLAFSNLLGSNLFNVVVLAVDDVAYREGPILKAVSPVHAVTAFSAVMMTGLVVIALLQPPQRRVFNTASGMSLLLLGVYALNAYVVFSISPGG